METLALVAAAAVVVLAAVLIIRAVKRDRSTGPGWGGGKPPRGGDKR